MNFILKIELTNTAELVVWRKICVPVDITFDQLHIIIQMAFGWRNAHLYQFSENGISDLMRIGSPHDEESPFNAVQTPIKKIMFELLNLAYMSENQPKSLKYIYDYGDFWEHDLVVEKFVRELQPSIAFLAGGGACPPEDCGGTGGFEALKKELRTGEIDEHYGDSFKPWLNGVGYRNYNPDFYDVGISEKGLAVYIKKNKEYVELLKYLR